MANRVTQLATLMMLTAIITGCQTVNTYEPADSQAVKHIVIDKRVETDPDLADKARMQQLITAHTPEGFLKVQAQLYNSHNDRARINYRFEWIDSSGMLIDTPMSSWKQISIMGRESVMIQAIAPTKTTADFRLKLVESPR